ASIVGERCGRTPVEIAWRCPLLSDQVRANRFAIDGVQTAIGLVGENHLSNCRDDAGVNQPSNDGKEQRHHNSRSDGFMNNTHTTTPSTRYNVRCRTTRIRSMSLIPMNGIIMPPIP